MPHGDHAPAPRAEVIAVPFLSGHIPCVEVDGEPMVILKPISDSIGLAWAPQYTKLSADQTTCVTFTVTQLPGDTQARRVMVVSLETFTLWLGGLQPTRVSEGARDTVIGYKREAGRVLREHFFGRRDMLISEGDELAEMERLSQQYVRAIALAKRERLGRQVAEAEVQALAPGHAAWEAFVDASGLIHPAVFAQQSRLMRPNGKPLGQNSLIEALRDLRILKNVPGTNLHNTPFQRHTGHIVSRPERAGRAMVNVPYVVPSAGSYLFGRLAAHFDRGQERLSRPDFGDLRAIQGGPR